MSVNFYRAWACLYVCRALYCCGKSVCPSVCLSHSSIAWKRMHTPSNSFRRLAGAWLYFRALARYIIPRGSLSAGALNTRDWENLRFSTDVAVYLGNSIRYARGYYGTPIGSRTADRSVPMSINRFQCRFQWPWVTLKGGVRFMANFHNYAQTHWPTATKFGACGSSVFLGEAQPIPRGRAPSFPCFWDLIHARRWCEKNNNQILHGDQTTRGKNYMVDHECRRAICLR